MGVCSSSGKRKEEKGKKARAESAKGGSALEGSDHIQRSWRVEAVLLSTNNTALLLNLVLFVI